MNMYFMDPGLLVGMVFTGCVPTTISSNSIMTDQAHGNQALTVIQSTLRNCLGSFVTPLLIGMYLATRAWYTHVVMPVGAEGLGELYRKVFKQLCLFFFLSLVWWIPQFLTFPCLLMITPAGRSNHPRSNFPNFFKKVLIELKVNNLRPLYR